MTLKVRTSGIEKMITRMRVRQNPGVKLITMGRVRVGGVLKEFLSTTGGGSVNPTFVRGFGRSNSTITVVTQSTTAQGGASYAWAQATGDADWEILYPASAATAFRHNNTAPDNSYDATFVVTITYAGGGTTTATVSATAVNISTL